MVYAGARYYLPALGRWMSVDPLADKYPEWSPYNYVFNNPLRLADPTGNCPEGVNHGDTFVDDTGSEVVCFNPWGGEGMEVEGEDKSQQYDVSTYSPWQWWTPFRGRTPI